MNGGGDGVLRPGLERDVAMARFDYRVKGGEIEEMRAALISAGEEEFYVVGCTLWGVAELVDRHADDPWVAAAWVALLA